MMRSCKGLTLFFHSFFVETKDLVAETNFNHIVLLLITRYSTRITLAISHEGNRQ